MEQALRKQCDEGASTPSRPPGFPREGVASVSAHSASKRRKLCCVSRILDGKAEGNEQSSSGRQLWLQNRKL